MKLEEIEKYLEIVEEKIENASYETLLKLEEKGKKYENYLHGYINHLKKQKDANVDDARFLRKRVTKALKQIRSKKHSLKEEPKVKPKTIKKVNYSKLVTGHAHVLAVRKFFQNLETIYCYV